MPNFTEIRKCRVCEYPKLTPFWSAGEIYVVGFPEKQGEGIKAPLTLVFCERCFLVQLSHSVKPDLMYREFFYRSGTNEMMRAALKDVVEKAVSSVSLQPADAVLDIGCNDGTLLLNYPSDVIRVGIDPARNIQPKGEQPSGWLFVNDFFSERAARRGYRDNYKIITALAMFYDLEDPVQFLYEVKKVLHPDGVFIVQMNYLGSMLATNGIDNVCHEHLTYFSLTTLMECFNRAGLHIYNVEVNDVNGGSIRVYASHPHKKPIQRSVVTLLSDETDKELNSVKSFGRFSTNVQSICRQLNSMLTGLYNGGKEVWAYGASTRGTTLLQLLDTQGKVRGCAERAPEKYAKFMVGSWLEIYSEEVARLTADYFLVLPWHFLPAILKREEKWMARGGKIICPLPEPRVYEESPVESVK